MSAQSAENDARLTEAEREALAEALPDGLQPVGAGLKYHPLWREGSTAAERLTGYGSQILDALSPAIERVIAARLAEALAIVKRACDGECKSPGKHTGCHAHEPYRVLATTVIPPGEPR